MDVTEIRGGLREWTEVARVSAKNELLETLDRGLREAGFEPCKGSESTYSRMGWGWKYVVSINVEGLVSMYLVKNGIREDIPEVQAEDIWKSLRALWSKL